MRGALCLAMLVARFATAVEPTAGTIPVAVARFETRCFDAKQLAARLSGRLPPGTPVELADHRGGAHVSVVAADEADGVVIRVVARDHAGRVTGSEVRWLPAGDCTATLDAAALIVARAATPLSFRELPSPVRVEPHPRVRPRSIAPAEPAPPAPPATEPEPPTPPPVAVLPPPPPAPIIKAAVFIPPAPAPVAVVTQQRPSLADRWHVDLAVRGQWSFPLDGGPSAPAGELALGYRWSRWGVELRGGIADDWGRSVMVRTETVGVSARRVPLSLSLTVRFLVRGGAIRLNAGPLVALWIVNADGATRGNPTVLAEAGVTIGASYRLYLGHLFLEGGLQLDVAFTSDRLTITGAGSVAQTPFVAAAPYLGAGVRF